MWSSGAGDISTVGAMFECGRFFATGLRLPVLVGAEQSDEATNCTHGITSQRDV